MRDEDREEKKERIRAALALRGWHQPSFRFCEWWEPNGFNSVTGAETGGHPAAFRKCVHRETREIRKYGISAVVAFNTGSFREEYHQWLKDGQPSSAIEADGTTATQADTLVCLREIKAILKDSPIMSKVEVPETFSDVRRVMQA